MNSRLSELKVQIDELRALKGPKARLPRQIWDSISRCSQDLPLKEICTQLDLNFPYAQSKTRSKAPLPKLVQLQGPAHTHNPLLELSLNNGATIRIFNP